MVKTTVLLSLFFIIVALFSCSVKMARLEEEREAEVRMLENLLHYNAEVRTFNAKATVIYRDENSVMSFKASMIFDCESDSFRMDLFDFVFGKPVLTVVKNGQRVLTVVHTSKESNIQSYDEFDLQRMTGLSIPKELLLSSVIGKVYLGEGSREISRSGQSTLIVKTPLIQSDIHFGRERLPTRVKYVSARYSYELSFTKFETSGAVTFPLKITLKDTLRMLTVNYSNPLINIELEEKDFLIENQSIESFKVKGPPNLYQNEHANVYFLTHLRVSYFFN